MNSEFESGRPEKLDPLDRSDAGVVLMNAMVASCSDTQFSERFIDPCLKDGIAPVKVDVVLTVNGFQVPFMETVNAVWKDLDDKFDEMVRQEAWELIGTARLEKLASTMDRFEWELKEALRNAGVKNTD